MELLYELARQNIRYKRVLESLMPIHEDSQIKKLYEIVYSVRQLNDNQAMLEIYGRKNLAAFSRLKSRLTDAFLKTTIFQNANFESTDIRTSEGITGYRQTLVSRILFNKQSSKIAIGILEKSLPRAIKFHITDSVLSQVKMLVSYYASIEYNKYKLNKYLAIQDKYLNIYKWEIKAENYFFDLHRIQQHSLANTSQEIKEKASNYVNELNNVIGIRSYFFNYNKYRVNAAYYEYNKDYNALLALCENAYFEFNQQDFKTGIALTSITIRRAWALIQAGRLEECIQAGNIGMKRLLEGSTSWYVMAHYTLKALLYSNKLPDAVELVSVMINHSKFAKQGETFREIYNTTLGYIHLLVDSKIFNSSPELKQKLPDFKLGKFLNTTPVFSKDKRGINVSIILMHIAFLLQRKDYNAIIDRIDSLNQYCYRYLRKDDSFRSNCMIKMVVKMAKADFNPYRTQRYTAELKKQLNQVTLLGSGENIEVEIIPFELLWDIMYSSL